MGNYTSCFSQSNLTTSKGMPSKGDSRRNSPMQDQILFQHLLLHSQTFKSHSQKYYSSNSSRASSSKQDLLHSASARPRYSNFSGDLGLQSQQLLTKRQENNSLESKKFVLIHGGGFGAWCWYKSIALLEEAGFVVDALDLSGSGIDPTNPNEITSLEQYASPLLSYLEKLAADEKVYLVGHSSGGACISYAMELFAKKIAKAIFVAGTMLKNGQSALDAFSLEIASYSEFAFVYANGSSSPPTSIQLDKNHFKEVFFNRTSAKDIALSSVSIRPVPFAPVVEKLLLTQENYGSVRRFFIQAMEDQTFSSAVQEQMICMNPPEQVLKLKGSDHCPFFSKPQSLHALFMEIVLMEPKK